MALNYDTLTALIKAKYIAVLYDQIFKKRMLLSILKKKAETFNGRKMVVPLEYGESDKVQFTGEMQTYKLGVVDPITAAEYVPSMLTGTLTISKEEDLKTKTADEVKSILTAKMKNLSKSIDKKVATELWIRTQVDANAWANMDTMLSATVDCGGIAIESGVANKWWRTPIVDVAGAGYNDNPAVVDDLLDENKDVYIFKLLQRGVGLAKFQPGEDPNIIVLSQYLWDLIEFIYDAQKKGDKMNKMAADLGFKALDFRGIPVVADDDMVVAQDGDTDGRIAFLNYDYLYFYFNSAAKFSPNGIWIEPANQNSRTTKIHAFGGMVTSNRQAHSVLTNIRSPKGYVDSTAL